MLGKTEKWVNELEEARIEDIIFSDLLKLGKTLGCKLDFLFEEDADIEELIKLPRELRRIALYGTEEEIEKLIALGEKLLREHGIDVPEDAEGAEK